MLIIDFNKLLNFGIFIEKVENFDSNILPQWNASNSETNYLSYNNIPIK